MIGSWRESSSLAKIGNKVQQYVGTRSSAQARSHAQKVFAKASFTKSSSANLEPQSDLAQVDEGSEVVHEDQADNQAEVQNEAEEELKVIKSPRPSPKKVPREFATPAKNDWEEKKDLELEKPSQGVKRKWTFDITHKNDDEFLMIENDEVSQKLLK